MFVQVCTCPDIAFVANVFGRYLNNPSLAHLQATKQVMRYLQGTKDYVLTYGISYCLEVKGYTNFDMVVAQIISNLHPDAYSCWLKVLFLGRVLNKHLQPLQLWRQSI